MMHPRFLDGSSHQPTRPLVGLPGLPSPNIRNRYPTWGQRSGRRSRAPVALGTALSAFDGRIVIRRRVAAAECKLPRSLGTGETGCEIEIGCEIGLVIAQPRHEGRVLIGDGVVGGQEDPRTGFG
jgi:hypothetical protein